MDETLEQINGEGNWIKISDNFDYLIEDPVEVLERRIKERDKMYGFGGNKE
ncbi:MAG: hypothetical protein AABX50_00210 [Nanoarchaeota archaeon]